MPNRAGALRPVTDLLPLEKVPEVLVPLLEKSSEFLAYTHTELAHVLGGRLFRITIAIRAGYPIRIPGVDGIALIIGDQFAGWLLLPLEFRLERPRFAIRDLKLRLRIDADWLRPAELIPASGDRPARIMPLDDVLDIEMGELSVTVDEQGRPDVDFDWEIDLPLCTIGETGLGLEAMDVRYYGKESEPAPGQPAGSKGIAIGKAVVYMPEFLAKAVPTLTATDCFIGSGGFTGRVAGKWAAVQQGNGFTGPGSGDLFGVPFAVDEIALALRQGAFEESSIRGRLILPFFDDVVDIDISIDDGGKISVALDADGGLKTVTKDGFFQLTLDSLRFDLDDGVFTARLSGKIKPLVAGFDWPEFDVDELAINSKGDVWVKGGLVDLPKGYTLDIAAFRLEITKFGAGKDENGDQYIAFNGALDLVKGIPAGASAEGLRITWGKDDKPHVSFERVGVELTVPDKLHFKGEVSYEENGDDRAFTGAITLELPALNDLALDGKIVFGSILQSGKRVKYFAIYFEGEFGKGVPLWTTGLDLKGIAGLFSVNYAPDKTGDAVWYSIDHSKSWYHKPPVGVTDITKKWAPRPGTMAVGAGARIASGGDNGFLFNGRFILLLLFPGPVALLHGRGSMLEKPSSRSDAKEPAFQALAVLDAKAGYFLLGLDARWKYDKERGSLAEIAGSAEAFFDFTDPLGWYISIGKETPLAQRIRASFALGLQANAYFRLDPRSLAVGVWIGKQDQFRFGPVRARLEAWLDANALLSFNPAHLKAAVWFHGLLGIKVFRWGFNIGLDARLEADVARPFHIIGSLTIRIETRLKDFEFEVRVEFGPQTRRPAIPDAFRDAGIGHFKSTAEWPLLLDQGNSVSEPVVPLDGRPYLTFEHPVQDAVAVGINPAPGPGWIMVGNPPAGPGAARVRYVLSEVALDKHVNGTWQPFAGNSTGSGVSYPRPLYGSWAAVPANPAAGGAAAGQNRLTLWARTPFELTDNTAGWNPWVGDNLAGYPCPVVPDERICIDWAALPAPSTLAAPWSDPHKPSIEVHWSGGTREVVEVQQPVSGLRKGIHFPGSQGQPRTQVLAYVANQASDTITVIDTATDRVSGGPIRPGDAPLRLAITPDGARLLVANAADATLSIIDTATGAPAGPPIAVRPQPAAVAVHPNGTIAYVTSLADRVISVVDLQQRAVVREIALPARSHAVGFLPAGAKAYARHPRGPELSIIDVPSHAVTGTAAVALPQLAVSPDGTRLYLPDGNERVDVHDTATDRLDGNPIRVGRVPAGIAVSPDGTRLYVSNLLDDTLSVIDVPKRLVIATIPTGSRPIGVAVTPGGTKVYVANSGSNDVTVIATATNTVLGTIAVGSAPESIAVANTTPVGGAGPDAVQITVPEGTALIELTIETLPGGVATATVLEPRDISLRQTSTTSSQLRVHAATWNLRDGIRRIGITCDAAWTLLRVCIVRPALPGGLAGVTAVHDQIANGISVLGQPAAVLEPFTAYRLRATVDRTIEGLGKLGGWHEQTSLGLVRTFRTGGPPGLAALSVPAGVTPENSATGLEDLTRYVAQTIPETLTLPGERPVLQRPVFRGYDIGCGFNEDYVDRMYELAARDLAVHLFDSNDLPVRRVDGSLAVLANQWSDAAEVQLSETHAQWIEQLDAATCVLKKIDPKTLPRNKVLPAAECVLDAGTLYEARLVPLLLRAPQPGGAGWTEMDLQFGLRMTRRSEGKPELPDHWTDMLVRVTLQPVAIGPSGIAFRHRSSGCYALIVDVANGRRTLMRFGGGDQVLASSGFAFDAAETYRFSIEAVGSHLRVEQDGEPVFEVDDATHPKGSVGLFPWQAGGPLRHLDLAVHDFRKGAPVAYRIAFTTSEYVDFYHQIHAFQDRSWSAPPLPPAIDLAAAVRATDLAAPATADEARSYDRVADALLQSAANQRAERLEVTRVEQGGAVQALLVRGDEPIDWRRTRLDVLAAAEVHEPEVAPGTMKLTEAAFGWMQLGGDVVEVLLREELDAGGARIEARLPAGPLARADDPPLFADRFAEGDLADWMLVDQTMSASAPSWQAADGALRLTSPAAGGGDPAFLGAYAAAGDPAWHDVVLSARVSSAQGGAVGVLFRVHGGSDYYRFSMDAQAGYRQLVKNVAGTFTTLWRDDVAYVPLREYALTIIAAGSSLRGYLDGVPLFAVTDGAHAAGIIGCYVSQNEAAFSGVRVDSMSRAAGEWLLDERFTAAVSDRWLFTTNGNAAAPWPVAGGALTAPPLASGDVASAIAGDAAWTDYRLTARLNTGASGVTDVVFRRQAADRFYALRFDPAAAGVRLLKVVDGIETILWQDTWSRRDMLVTIDCAGPHFTCFIDGEVIVLHSDGELVAGAVGVTARGAGSLAVYEVRVAAPVWTRWYTFDSERRREAGTRLRVHGTEFDLGLPPVLPGTIRKLAAPGSRTPDLPVRGVDLRIVRAGGVVEHARHFVPYEAFSPVAVDLVRNADGTGFFILPKSGSLAAGTYRLALQYERDKSGVTPVLRRGGSTEPERVYIDVPVPA